MTACEKPTQKKKEKEKEKEKNVNSHKRDRKRVHPHLVGKNKWDNACMHAHGA